MKLQTFNNKKGLIYGNDPKRIGCDIEGIIKIGSAQIKVSPGADSVMPLLFYGADGDFKGTFVSGSGEEYDLGKIAVRGGRVVPPSLTAVEFMELRCKCDELEATCAALHEKTIELEHIFDTDALNFLIKQDKEN